MTLYYEMHHQKTEQRTIGGGRKGALNSMELKLFSILFYLKAYPTYNLASAILELIKVEYVGE